MVHYVLGECHTGLRWSILFCSVKMLHISPVCMGVSYMGFQGKYRHTLNFRSILIQKKIPYPICNEVNYTLAPINCRCWHDTNRIHRPVTCPLLYHTPHHAGEKAVIMSELYFRAQPLGIPAPAWKHNHSVLFCTKIFSCNAQIN